MATNDPAWGEWSASSLADAADDGVLGINPLIHAETSVGYGRIEDLEAALPAALFRRDPLPCEAAFLAAKCFADYRGRGGQGHSPLPDFYIGAHAAVAGFRLLTRDAAGHRTYFPTVPINAPT